MLTEHELRTLRMVVAQWDGCGQEPEAWYKWMHEFSAEEPPIEYLGDKVDVEAILDKVEALFTVYHRAVNTLAGVDDRPE